MKANRRIGKGKSSRTVGQIDSILSYVKDAMFTILVPAYLAIDDGADDEDCSLNREILLAVGRIIASGKYRNCPECERILLVGAKSPYPFVHFHEFLTELKRNGA